MALKIALSAIAAALQLLLNPNYWHLEASDARTAVFFCRFGDFQYKSKPVGVWTDESRSRNGALPASVKPDGVLAPMSGRRRLSRLCQTIRTALTRWDITRPTLSRRVKKSQWALQHSDDSSTKLQQYADVSCTSIVPAWLDF